VRLVYVGEGRADGRDVLVARGAGLVNQGRQLLARRLALLGADADVEAAVARAVGAVAAHDVERDDAPPVVEGDAVYEGDERGLHLLAADADQFGLHALRVVQALDAHLVVDAEDHQAAARVGERDDTLGDLLRVCELDLEFEKSIFAAAHQSHQLRAGSLRRRNRGEILLERAFRGGFVSLVAAEFSASHLCLDGALAAFPPGCAVCDETHLWILKFLRLGH
jgi:hypothetical protein